MKKLLLISLTFLALNCLVFPQLPKNDYGLKPEFRSCQHHYTKPEGKEYKERKNPKIGYQVPKSPGLTNGVSIIDIGTSYNAYSYGYNGGQRSILSVNDDLNMIVHFHRMGGALDPGGYSGDLGYDISMDGGETFTSMIECYVATEIGGGQYYADAARFPNHGLYNPTGNTLPENAIVAFFAPNLDNSNDIYGFGGYSYGIHHVGSEPNVDTTKNLLASRPDEGFYQYTPNGFCMVNPNAEYWVADLNQDWTNGSLTWLEEMIISRGVWNNALEDFELEQFILDCETYDDWYIPPHQKIEFSPDGQTGYIAVLSDNGSVPISEGLSYYPILWRTTDAGATWSGPIAVPLAGPDGIADVRNYLTNTEIEELFEEPVPARDEIPFTTAFDFDMSVDSSGNPHMAVIIGVTGYDPYQIVTDVSVSSGNAYTCAFLLSSYDNGNEGSWIGYELGRPKSFRGYFSDLEEDNRIQIARNNSGTKMFVSWLDTDPDVSSENNSPDIWARGVDIFDYKLTADIDGEDQPDNVTFGSQANAAAYFFIMGNEVLTDGTEYTIPYSYQQMTPYDPLYPVQYKYIQDFSYDESDFAILYQGTTPKNLQASVSGSTVDLSWEAPPTSGLLGYYVYRDSVRLNSTYIQTTNFTDTQVPEGLHQYYVTALFDVGESAPSNVVYALIQNVEPQYFEPVWTSLYNPMTIYVTEATIDFVNLQEGDEIGIFDVDPYSGDEICVGAAVLSSEISGTNYLELIASMNDGSNPDEANGFIPGNPFIFKFWSETYGEVVNVTVDFPYPGYDENFTGQGSAIVELTGFSIMSQVLYLQQGWNIFSSKLIPENPDMMEIVQPLIDDEVLIMVLNEDYGSILHLPFPPPNGQWINTIGDMQITDGYYTKVSENSNFAIEGILMETPLNIPLNGGWNIISYPCDLTQDAFDVIQELVNQYALEKVIDQEGGAIFHLPFPEPNGQWYNTIGDFTPGEGYFVKVDYGVSLSVSCTSVENQRPVSVDLPKQNRLEYFEPVYENNPYLPMHFAIQTNEFINDGDEVAVFDGDICVGASVYQDNPEEPFVIITSMDDPDTDIQDGFTPENNYYLLVYDHQDDQLFVMEYELMNQQSAFEKLETTILETTDLVVGTNSTEAYERLVEVSPNPFHETTSVILYLENEATVNIKTKTLNGELIAAEQYLNLPGGKHRITQDLSNTKNGVFILLIELIEDQQVHSFTKKLVKF